MDRMGIRKAQRAFKCKIDSPHTMVMNQQLACGACLGHMYAFRTQTPTIRAELRGGAAKRDMSQFTFSR